MRSEWEATNRMLRSRFSSGLVKRLPARLSAWLVLFVGDPCEYPSEKGCPQPFPSLGQRIFGLVSRVVLPLQTFSPGELPNVSGILADVSQALNRSA